MESQQDEQDKDVLEPAQAPWSTRAQLVAAVLWPSFLSACLATMLFFAFVDPGLIHGGGAPDIRRVRMAGYGTGFFFFWLVTAVSSAVSLYLVRTSHIPAEDEPGNPPEHGGTGPRE